MSGNPYERLLDEQGPAADPTPANPYEALVEEEMQARDRELRASWAAGTTLDPEKAARVIRARTATGLPFKLVADNLELVEKTQHRERVDPEQWFRQGPVLSGWLGTPENAAVAQDDVKQLQGLEWWFGGHTKTAAGRNLYRTPGGPEQGFQRGTDLLQQSLYGVEAMKAGTDPDLDPRITALDASIGRDIGDQDRGFLARSAVGAASILPGVAYGGGMGAAFGSGAAGAALAFGPQGAPFAAGAGTAGALAGVFYSTYQQEAGAAYIDIVRSMKARGGPVDFKAAQTSAAIIGMVNGALEVLPAHQLLKVFPVLKAAFRAGASSEARRFLPQSFLRAIGKAVADAGLQLAFESGTEGAQRLVTDVGSAVATGEKVSAGQLAANVTDETLNAAVSMWPLLVLPGAMQFREDAERARNAKASAARLADLAQRVQASKLATRSPEKLGELAEKLTEATGHPETVYIPVEAWNQYWQSQNDDPARAAGELGQSSSYATAAATGADFAVPFPVFLARVASSQHGTALLSDVKLDPNDMTAREAEAWRADRPAREADLQAMTSALEAQGNTADGIRDAVREKLTATGFEDAIADRYAQVYESFFRTMAERTGLAPAELFARYQLDIERAGTASPTAGVAEGTSTPPAAPATAPARPGRPAKSVAEPVVPTAAGPAAAPGAVPAAAPTPATPAAPGTAPAPAPASADTSAFSNADPSKQYPLRYKVVSLDDLITSHDEGGTVNSAFPADLQPRNRSTAASKAQIRTMASTNAAEAMLAEQRSISRGTPITGQGDNIVESGNGRTLALRGSRAENNEQWQTYQRRIAERAAELGLSIEGIKDPVLVRERAFPLSPEERVQFTREANGLVELQSSPTERAKLDSERLNPQLLRSLPVSEEGGIARTLLTQAGASWMREFLAGVPATEYPRFVDQAGQTGLHGIKAVEMALFYHVFGWGPGDRILRSFAEAADESRQNLERGLFGAIPRLAKLTGLIHEGETDAQYDIGRDLATAADVFRRIKKEGKSVGEYVRQAGLFGAELSPFQQSILETIDKYARNGARLAGVLNAYANAAMEQEPPSQRGMFADVPRPTKEQLWNQATTQPVGPSPAQGELAFGQENLAQGPVEAGPTVQLLDFTPSPGLSPEERAVETRFMEQLASDPEHWAEVYNARPDTAYGLILNADIVKELSPDYAADGTLATAVHEPSSAFIKFLTRRAFERPASGKVLILAGGGGSGKSSSALPQHNHQDYDVIVDTSLSKMTSFDKLLTAARRTGRPVVVHYVHKRIETATEAANARAFRAGEMKGRAFPLVIMGSNHFGAQRTLLGIADRAEPDVTVMIDDNDVPRGTPPRRISVDELRAASYKSVLEVLEAAHESFQKEKAAGRTYERQAVVIERGLSDAIARGKAGGDQSDSRRGAPDGSPDLGGGAARDSRGERAEVEPPRTASAPTASRWDTSPESIATIPGELAYFLDADPDLTGFSAAVSVNQDQNTGEELPRPFTVHDAEGAPLVSFATLEEAQTWAEHWVDDFVELAQAGFHGGPYKFEKFLLEKIGTGEGAQVYGWGLYFTSMRAVAEWYRKSLTRRAPEFQGRDFSPEAFEAALVSDNPDLNADLLRLIGTYVGNGIAHETIYWRRADRNTSTLIRAAINRRTGRTSIGDAEGEALHALLEENEKAYTDALARVLDDVGEEQEADPNAPRKVAIELEFAGGRRAYNRAGRQAQLDLFDLNGRLSWFASNANEAVRQVREQLENTVLAQREREGKETLESPESVRRSKEAKATREQAERELKLLDGLDTGELRPRDTKPRGQVYQVDIPEDEDLLHWDKPVTEQPEKVRAVIDQAIAAGLAEPWILFDREKAATEIDRLIEEEAARRFDELVDDGDVAVSRPGVVVEEVKQDDDEADDSPSYRYGFVVSSRGAVEWDVDTFDTYLEAQDAGEAAANRIEQSQLDDARYEAIPRLIGEVRKSGWLLEAHPELTGKAADGKEFYMQLSTALGDDKAASHYLRDNGVPGHSYQGDSSGAKNFVIYDDSRIKIENTFYQGENDRRGFIRFSKGGRAFKIGLLEGADLSTFLHETGHFFLEVTGDLASDPNADPALKADYDTLLAWLGAPNREGITGEHHEKFARGFEAWLMEGEAPSRELAGAFARFRAWLIAIYQKIDALRVELTPQVREVLSRMVASDTEIAKAERSLGYEPLFKDAAGAGWTRQEFEAYVANAEQARTEARTRLTRELIEEKRRETRAWWHEERAQLREKIAAEVDARPEYRAGYFLRTGRFPDGAEVPKALLDPQGRPLKLSKQALEQMYKAEAPAILRKLAFAWSRTGGIHPSAIAPMLGFRSADEMIRAVVSTRPRAKVIEGEVRRQMLAKYGDLLHDGRLGEAAIAAAHAPAARARMLFSEYRALWRRAGREGPATPYDIFKREARQLVSRRKVRDINADHWRRAEAKAQRAAEKALAVGDYEGALLGKQQALINHALFMESREAREAAEKAANYLRKMGQTPAMKRLGKAGADYAARITKLLERFEFARGVSVAESDRRDSLAAWVEAERAAGRDPVIPPRLLDETYRTSWRNLSVEELLGLHDAVRNIAHLAKVKNSLLTTAGQRALESARDELIGALRQNLPDRGPLPLDPKTKRGFARAASWLKQADAALLKMEELIRRMDGDDINGPWSRYLWDPIAAAQFAEAELTQEYALKVASAFSEIPKEIRATLLEEVHVPALGQAITREAMLAMALNTGNESNYRKLVESRPRAALEWGPDVVEGILGKLTRAEWDYVQRTWDTIEGLWPQIAGLEQRLTGIAPPKIERKAFERTFGGETVRYAGGYYPVVYDRRQSRAGRLQAEENTASLFDAGYRRAITPHGHTIERIENFTDPILLSLDVLPRHLSQVIHDLTHREALLSGHKLLTDPAIREVMFERLGEEYADTFLPWLKAIANDRNPVTPGTAFFRGARQNASVVAMGFKATTILQNFANFGNALEAVPAKYLAPALMEWVRHPMAMTEAVQSKSKEMKHRFNHLERDVRDKLRSLQGDRSFRAGAQRFAFYGIALTDACVSYPTWLAAYRQGLDKGLEEDAAIRAANRAVTSSQGAAGAKDLSAVQRNNEMLKWLTMFYSYWNVVYNRGRSIGFDVARDARERQLARNFPKYLARTFFLWMIPAIASELLSGRGPDDDDDGWLDWSGAVLALYPFLSVPLLRDVASAVDRNDDVRIGPIERALDQVAKTVETAAKFTEGEGDLGELAGRLFETSGYIVGLPVNQAEITTTYLYDVMTGEEHPDDFWEFVRGILYRRRKSA